MIKNLKGLHSQPFFLIGYQCLKNLVAENACLKTHSLQFTDLEFDFYQTHTNGSSHLL